MNQAYVPLGRNLSYPPSWFFTKLAMYEGHRYQTHNTNGLVGKILEKSVVLPMDVFWGSLGPCFNRSSDIGAPRSRHSDVDLQDGQIRIGHGWPKASLVAICHIAWHIMNHMNIELVEIFQLDR